MRPVFSPIAVFSWVIPVVQASPFHYRQCIARSPGKLFAPRIAPLAQVLRHVFSGAGPMVGVVCLLTAASPTIETGGAHQADHVVGAVVDIDGSVDPRVRTPSILWWVHRRVGGRTGSGGGNRGGDIVAGFIGPWAGIRVEGVCKGSPDI